VAVGTEDEVLVLGTEDEVLVLGTEDEVLGTEDAGDADDMGIRCSVRIRFDNIAAHHANSMMAHYMSARFHYSMPRICTNTVQ